MDTLAVAFAAWVADNAGAIVDTVVIGSGYGGSVAALRLSQMGRQVVVLERGSEYLPGEFPNEFGQMAPFQRVEGPTGPMGRPSGLFNWRIGSSFGALVANGLGGGSLINAGVVMQPQPEVFAQPAWPVPIRYNSDEAPELLLEHAFERARKTLGTQAILPEPGARLPPFAKARALGRLGDELKKQKETATDVLSIRPANVTIDQVKCTACGDCFSGCNVPGAKLTLRETYLRRALQEGATIVTGALVWTLEPHEGDWLLHCIATERSTYRASVEDAMVLEGVRIRARNVVIAAGTFGSTELLQRSSTRIGSAFPLSPVLGTRLSGNGDSLSASVDESEVVDGLGNGPLTEDPSPRVGSTITSVLDLRGRDNMLERLVIQEGAVPGALVETYQEILATTWVLNHIGSAWNAARSTDESEPLGAPRKLAAHSQLLLTMGHDSASGRIVYMPDMDASVPYWVRPEDELTYKRQATVLAFAKKLGGKHFFSPLWQALPPAATDALGAGLFPPTTLTVHPLGGCPMGDDFGSGVVDDRGRVFRAPGQVWTNLTVLDGSIVPTSLGCNPLLTITALAERSMAYLQYEQRKLSEKIDVFKKRPSLLPSPRSPVPVARSTPLTFDVELSERLVCQDFDVSNVFDGPLGARPVQAAFEVNMRARDWTSIWRAGRHRMSELRGELSLLEPVSGAKATYRIVQGTIDLIDEAPSREWAPLSTLRAALTWLFLRGIRDIAQTGNSGGWPAIWARIKHVGSIYHMWAQAGSDKRLVRYQIRLQRANASEPASLPAELDLSAYKDIQYAAGWGGLLSHVWQRFILRNGVPPGALRRTYVEALTEPLMYLSLPGPAGRWTRTFATNRTGSRFHFDPRFALSKSPAALLGGGDSSSAMLALSAYPALILRHALKTRIFDFRLPDYSGKQVLDQVPHTGPDLRWDRVGTRDDVSPELSFVKVRRGRSSADDGTEAPDNLSLPMWRYRRPGEGATPEISEGTWNEVPVRRAKSVLLMHAFGMSGSTFTLQTIHLNLAEYFYRKGYEVWIFDSRMSPRVGGSALQGTLDQVGLIDAPAAVDHILGVLENELSSGPLLQIFSFAHCLGSGAMLVGLLGGKLSHPVQAPTPRRPMLPKLAGLVCSQVHPFMVGSKTSMSKTWVAPLARDLFLRVQIPLAVRAPIHSLADQLFDRAFASLPVPEGEHCPDEGLAGRRYDDDCATCRRIRFLDGEVFKHRNINVETHKALPRLFGPANVRLFAHGSKLLDYERLVNEDGLNAYVTDEAIDRYLAMPIRFVHGEVNELFNVESATRSSGQFARIHPDFSAQFAAASGWCHNIIKGYGHLDPLIGDKAHIPPAAGESVFDQLGALLDEAWNATVQPTPHRSDPPLRVSDARFPAVGPFASPVKIDSKTGQRFVDVAFVVDDLTESSAPAGVALEASAIVHQRHARRVYPLTIRSCRSPIVARDGFMLPRFREDPNVVIESPTTVRVAFGRLPAPPRGTALRAELFTHSDQASLGVRPAYDRKPQEHRHAIANGIDEANQTAGSAAATLAASSQMASLDIKTLDSAIAHTRTLDLNERVLNAVPFPPSLSDRHRKPLPASNRWLNVRAGTLDSRDDGDEVRIALGCCRYPGLPFDQARADETFRRLYSLARGVSTDRPHAVLMLGDQIYADASARIADPMGAVERFHRRHTLALSTPWIRRLLASTPVVMTPDDHEFVDNYPEAASLFSGTAKRRRYSALREAALRKSAVDAVRAFQFATYDDNARATGCQSFELGTVRVLVIDTRSSRRVSSHGTTEILTETLRTAISDWAKASTKSSLQIVCTGSVVFPELVPGTDPANPGSSDNWSGAPADRLWLLRLLVSEVPGRFVLVSGDYHLNFSAQILADGISVGAAVVAPPFYAPLPYANAVPNDLGLLEELEVDGASLSIRASAPAQIGSGYSILRLRKTQFANWSVAFETDVDDFGGQGYSGLAERGRWSM